MTILYRVEHPYDDRGPYTSTYDVDELVSAHNHSDEHPGPWNDTSGLGGITYTEHCACDSAESLLSWFSGFWEELAELGYDVLVIDAEDDSTRIGAYGQAVFPRDESDVVDRMDVSTFLQLVAP